MSGSTAVVKRAATLVGVCALVAAGAQASGAKTAAKGKATSGEAFVAQTHTAGGKTYVAGNGFDKLLGPGAVTAIFASRTPTSTPNVVKVTLKPMIVWLSTGTFKGSATVLLNTTTGALTNGHATFAGRSGTYKGHTLVASFHGTANLAAGQFHYVYTGVYR